MVIETHKTKSKALLKSQPQKHSEFLDLQVSLWKESASFQDKELESLIKGLSEILAEKIQILTISDQTSSERIIEGHLGHFVTRLSEFLVENVHRYEKLLQSVQGVFGLMCESQFPSLRSLGVELAKKLTIHVYEFKLATKKEGNWQEVIWKSFKRIGQSKMRDVKLSLLDFIDQFQMRFIDELSPEALLEQANILEDLFLQINAFRILPF